MNIKYFLALFLILLSFILPIYNIGEKRNYSLIILEDDFDNNRSIILMIGDGMGYEQLKLARWVEFGTNNSLIIENLPFNLNVTTYSANNAITDSAAAATAIATGNKTNNGMLSFLPSLQTLETILEIAQKLNKSTGIVTTTSITHATPAAFMTHVSSRSLTSEISRQIVENAQVDVLLGGGKMHFSLDQINQLKSGGYNIVENNTRLMESNSSKLFGLFAEDHMPYEINRIPNITPSLYNMTKKAIEILSKDSDGFFLMVEGGRIDHGGHANNKTNVALETIEFNSAVKYTYNYSMSHNDTLLILTADHETGGLTVLNQTLNQELPSTTKTFQENKNLRIQRINNITVGWETTSHTSKNVPFYGYCNTSINLSNSIIDNTDIFSLMKDYLYLSINNNTHLPDNPEIFLLIGGYPLIFQLSIILPIIIILSLRNKKERYN